MNRVYRALDNEGPPTFWEYAILYVVAIPCLVGLALLLLCLPEPKYTTRGNKR